MNLITKITAVQGWFIEPSAAEIWAREAAIQSSQPITPAVVRATSIARRADIIAKAARVYRGNGENVEYDALKQMPTKGDVVQKDGEEYGNIGIVYLRGEMVYEETWCRKNTEGTIQELQEMGNDPRIRGVMLVVNSPGGQVTGTERLANLVRDYSNLYKKKIFAYVEGMACSAAYWAISGATKIILAENSCILGSIGTMINFLDFGKFWDKNGVNEITVRASLSFNKGKAFDDAIDGKPETMRREMLDPTNANFLNGLKKNRGAKLGIKDLDISSLTTDNVPELLTGRVYVGQEAIDIGLADRVAKGDLVDELRNAQQWQRVDAPENNLQVVETTKTTESLAATEQPQRRLKTGELKELKLIIPKG